MTTREQRIAKLQLSAEQIVTGLIATHISTMDIHFSYAVVSRIEIGSVSFYAAFEGYSSVVRDSVVVDSNSIKSFKSSLSLKTLLVDFIETGDLPEKQEELKQIYEDTLFLKKFKVKKSFGDLVRYCKLKNPWPRTKEALSDLAYFLSCDDPFISEDH